MSISVSLTVDDLCIPKWVVVSLTVDDLCIPKWVVVSLTVDDLCIHKWVVVSLTVDDLCIPKWVVVFTIGSSLSCIFKFVDLSPFVFYFPYQLLHSFLVGSYIVLLSCSQSPCSIIFGLLPHCCCLW